ncbi:MOSC domain-containing protein [Deinococcus oregonensis]|uniref:MOSC domain-containing protein n=1 Tax=Deinococcus oregonensis TaxID=1805970 RepID=A0ABV6B5Z9_9DEIO
MHLLSVNVGRARQIAAKSGWTGIYKEPVSGPVHVQLCGLDGDQILDREHHGGPEQAVYVYTQPDYAFWTGQLGADLLPGTFGENLLFSELESSAVLIGQRFRVGTVVLEVTWPRVPCVTLAARMGDPAFVRKFREARRPGFYARVLQEGALQQGDEVTVEDAPQADGRTVVSLYDAFFEKPN